MPERLTRLFSSADGSSCSSDTSDSSSELWARTAVGGFSPPEYSEDGYESPSKLALPGLVAALRASRARSSAAQAKASRLVDETQRLRKALNVARKGQEKAEQCQNELAKSEDRVRELECDNRSLRRDLEGARLRTRKTEEKARHSLSSLRTALENLEQEERARCKRWRATTRSQRALLESLRRHAQRGHHSSPSYTAFQLMEQIFEGLRTQESEARLPSPSPGGHRRRPRSPPRPSSPGFPLSSSQAAATPRVAEAEAKAERPPPFQEPFGRRRRRPSNADEEDLDDALFDGGIGAPGLPARGRGGREEGVPEGSPASGGVRFFPGGGGGASSEEDFRPHSSEQAVRGGRGERGEAGGGFSTEWAYRLAVTKLTAQLKAARERLRGEKEASRLAGERAEQEELRCRQLELEVEGLSSKVAAADSVRRRLEGSLRDATRERDVLKRRQHSTAATHALNAALGILHQRRMPPPSSVYAPVAAPAPSPPPPPPPAPAPVHQSSAPPPQVLAVGTAAAAAAANATPRAEAVQEATANEALYYGGGGEGRDGGRLDPSTLTPAYSGGGESGGGDGWWDGHDKQEDHAFAHDRRHERPRQEEDGLPPQRHRAADATAENGPESLAPPDGSTRWGGAGTDAMRSSPVLGTPSGGWNSAAHARGDGGESSGGGGAGTGTYYTRSQIQRIVDDAVKHGTRGRGDGGPEERRGLPPASGRLGGYWRRDSDPDPDRGSGGSLLRGIGSSSSRPRIIPETASTAATRVCSGVTAESRLPTRAYKGGRVPAAAPEARRSGGISFEAKKVGVSGNINGGGGGSGGGVRGASSRAPSSWAQLGPRAVTREDLTRLDDEIANLSKTVEQAAMAHTRQKLRNATD
eukprot:g15975.t1